MLGLALGDLKIPRPHGRPWSGAFNVVMATSIVSTAALAARLTLISAALAVLAVVVFMPLAGLDVLRARHPITMLHRARQPGRAFPALGFVAATCVLGARVVQSSGPWRTIAAILLIAGVIVWVAICSQLAIRPARIVVMRARGEWLLATVSTEGLAILLAHLSDPLHWLAVVLWALGGVLYLFVMALLARRLYRYRLRPFEFTPDWWIVMGGAAIFALGAATVDRGRLGSPIGVLGLAAWAVASFWIPLLAAGELWRAGSLRPRFTPERWTMVFPIGMYGACSQFGGMTIGLGWLHGLGQGWVWVGLIAWLVVAAGEIHYAFRPQGSTRGFQP